LMWLNYFWFIFCHSCVCVYRKMIWYRANSRNPRSQMFNSDIIAGDYPIPKTGDYTWWQCKLKYRITNWKGWRIKEFNSIGESFMTWIYIL
jgi:hypothetical protein